MSVSVNGTNGLTFNDGSTQNTSPFAGGLGFRNRIINGACMIDQRNAGASVTASDGVYTLDRFIVRASQASKFTVQQNAGSVTPPAGFNNYLGVVSSSAYSVGSSDYFTIGQRIEGYNCADLNWGTANAATVTLSFKVYSSLTGTFGGTINNSDLTRSYPFTFTISAANTFETKTVTVVGDTSGTWDTTNGRGMQVMFGLGVGSTFSGTAGSWSGSTYLSATGATSVVGTSGATFYITGVQLEKGSTATSFDYRPYGTELALCQRYYTTINDFYLRVYQTAGVPIGQTLTLPVTMRATPTLTKVGTWAIGNGSGQPAAASASGNSTRSFIMYMGVSGSADSYFTTSDSSQYVTAAAEL